jgi:tetratricopeptide (TPR) repeat protein
MRQLALLFVLAALGPSLLLAQTPQPPWKAENLQYFPKDITRQQLTQRMREFSFGLNVRCQYCHVGGDGISFDGVVWASDEKPAKVKARAMLRMVDEINGPLLSKLPSRAEPRVTVDCVTCHRGVALPKTLQTTLLEIVNDKGAAAAVARYRELRRDQSLTGRYNFGEWEINELARQLNEAGKREEAIAILEMNGEFYPKSVAIDLMVAELHVLLGNRDQALARFRAALEKEPNNPQAKQRIADLEKK